MAQSTVRKRKTDPKPEDKQINGSKSEDKKEKDVVKPKYGPLITFPHQRVWSRFVLITAVMIIVWYKVQGNKEVVLARQKDVLISRIVNVDCSEDYKTEVNKYPGCIPERCARVVSDKLVSASEVDTLLRLAVNGFKFGESDGGASILDLESGALSKGTKFINIYKLDEAKTLFSHADFVIYKVVRTKIQHAIGHHFGVDSKQIYLTKPTFFSKITSGPAKTIHDEYWHPHVDKETYESFHYTSLLYLNDYNRDFEGGRFLYIDETGVNTTVEPRRGRVSMFTSGSENRHAVEKVTTGIRYALTVSFTCDKQFATNDPAFDKMKL